MSEEFIGEQIPGHPLFHSLIEDKEYHIFLDTLFENPGTDSLISLTMPMEGIDPLACLELVDDGESFHYFWEKPGDGFSMAAGNALVEITANGQNRFRDIRKQIADLKSRTKEYSSLEHSHSGLYFLGGFSFFDENGSDEWHSFGSASFTIPGWQVIKEGRLTLLTLNYKLSNFENRQHLEERIEAQLAQFIRILDLNPARESDTPPKSALLSNATGSDEAFTQWADSISQAKKLIREQKFEKIVIARKISIKLQDQLEPTHVVNSLREKFPDCYTFLIRQEKDKTFLGSTPERLVAFKKNYILTEALAGSMRRGTTATEDAVLEKKLLHSSKNANEHNFVVKAIEQRLKSLVNKIKKDRKPVIKKLSNVQHLFTPITAWLKDGTDPLSVIEQLHPTPAVGGYPWKEAAPYIKQLEHFDRGWYAGPVGWLNTNGGGEFAVAIRSSLINEHYVNFYAGCGIVEDSDPETEWQETILKLSPMLSALHYD